jgi:hypothetical protein
MRRDAERLRRINGRGRAVDTQPIEERLSTLEARLLGIEAAHRACLQTLMLSVMPSMVDSFRDALADVAAEIRQGLPAPAARRWFDVAIEEAQEVLGIAVGETSL